MNGFCLQIAYEFQRVRLQRTYKSINPENQRIMATFKTMVRYKRADGFYQVYIRVLHRSKSGYIKTDKYVTDKQITKSGDIKDAVVNSFCSQEILRYTELINQKDISHFSVNELIDFLQNSDADACFSDYASHFISRMEAEA